MDPLERRDAPQEHLYRLEEWAIKNFMKFNKDKCKVLRLGKHDPGGAAQDEIYLDGEQLCGKGPGVLVDKQLNMGEQSAEKINRMLSYIKNCHQQRQTSHYPIL